MKKYKQLLIFIPITFVINLAITEVFMKEELSTRPLHVLLLENFIESFVAGILFVWMWNYRMKRKQIQR